MSMSALLFTIPYLRAASFIETNYALPQIDAPKVDIIKLAVGSPPVHRLINRVLAGSGDGVLSCSPYVQSWLRRPTSQITEVEFLLAGGGVYKKQACIDQIDILIFTRISRRLDEDLVRGIVGCECVRVAAGAAIYTWRSAIAWGTFVAEICSAARNICCVILVISGHGRYAEQVLMGNEFPTRHSSEIPTTDSQRCILQNKHACVALYFKEHERRRDLSLYAPLWPDAPGSKPGRSRTIWRLSRVVGPAARLQPSGLRRIDSAPETHVEIACAITGGCLPASLPACNDRREGFMRQGTLEICDTMSAIISPCIQLFQALQNAKQDRRVDVFAATQSLFSFHFFRHVPAFERFVLKPLSTPEMSK